MKKAFTLAVSATMAAGLLAVAANLANGRYSRVNTPQVETAELPVDREAEKAKALNALNATTPVKAMKAAGMVASLPVPFELEPTAEDISYFTIIELNEGAGNYDTWKYNGSFKGLVAPSSSKHAENDWAITPKIQFTDADKAYELTFDAYTNMQLQTHCGSIDVYIGTDITPQAMTMKIGELKQFASPKKEQRVAFAMPFAVPAAGFYYIGFHCVTDPADCEEPWPVVLQKIAVNEKAGTVGAPQPVIGATAQAAPNGALKATVSFVMPSKDLTGTDIPAYENLTATIKSMSGQSVTETKTVTGKAASTQTLEINTAQGDNTIEITVAAGQNVSDPATIDVYTGVVKPMRVQGLTATVPEDNMSMTLTWQAPIAGENNGYCNFDDLDYDIYMRDAAGDYKYHTTVGKAKTYTHTMQPGARLASVALRVLPRNAAGTSTDVGNYTYEPPCYVTETLGVPHAMPATETFDNQEIKYTPVQNLYPTDYYGRWYLGDPTDIVPDENASALIGYNPLADGATRGRVALPKFSTKGLNSATFTLTYLRYGSNASNMYVYVTAWGDEPEKIATLNCSQVTDWRTETFPIPTKFQNREWIQVFIDVDLDDYYFMYAIDSYSFQTGAQVDLAVSDITGDEHVAAFATGNFQVEISNVGFTTVENAQLKLDLADGNEIVATQTKDLGKMEMGTRKTINAEFTPSAQYHGKKLAVNATIVSDADEQPGNNTMSHFFEVIAPDSPVVTDLDASSTDNRIRLWWSRPSQTRPYTESFEEITPFAYQGPMGEFATHDGDQQTVYMFQPSVNPMPNENLPKAFLAVDQTQLLNPTGLEAHSGKMYLMATCPEVTNEKPIPDKADDWLISPQVPGGHAVSFWVNIISEKYPETFEVLASATDNSPQSFTQKLKAATIERTGWQKLSVLLPDNARYFAIHYISHNMFGMMIDDITYPSMKDPYNITGYNIYRDGTKIASTAAETYDDTDVTLGNAYTYTVEALDGTRPYPMSKSYTIVHDNSAIGSAAATTAIIRGTEGAIILTNLAGTTVDIYDTTGRLAATARPESQYETVAIAPGAYIIATHRGIHAKVLVK